MIKNFNFKTIDLFVISILFFPGFFIFSRFLLDFYVSFLSIVCLIFIYQKKISLSQNKFFYYFLVFYIYLIFNSFFSFNLELSLYKSLPYIRLILFAVFLSYLITKYKSNIILPVIYSFTFFYTLLFIGSIYELILGKNVYNFITVNERISSFFGDELILGSYIQKTLPIIFSLIFLVREKITKKLDFYLITISTIMIILSAERTAFVQFALFIILFILFSYSRIEKLKLFSTYLFIILIIAIINPSSSTRLIKHTYSQITLSQNIFSPSFRHYLHYETAIKMFVDKKFLGQGLLSFRHLCKEKKFVPLNKILNNKRLYVYSPIDGIFTSEVDTVNGRTGVYYYVYPSISKNKNYRINLNSRTYLFKTLTDNTYVKKGDRLFISSHFKDGCNTHPHNYYLQLLAEIGIFGFIFLLTFFLYLIYEFTKKIKKFLYNKTRYNNHEISYIILLLGLLIFLLPLLPTGNFFNNWISIIFYSYLGLLFYFWSERTV